MGSPAPLIFPNVSQALYIKILSELPNQGIVFSGNTASHGKYVFNWNYDQTTSTLTLLGVKKGGMFGIPSWGTVYSIITDKLVAAGVPDPRPKP